MSRRLTTQEFIEKAKAVHGERYDYSLVEYVNAHKKIIIACRDHGIFEQSPSNHLSGSGCLKCGRRITEGARKIDINEFIRRSKERHGDRYDYSLVEYVNTSTKVKIICPDHGEFSQRPVDHTRLQGCPKCGRIKCDRNRLVGTEKFIKRAKERHGDRYDYSLVEYVKAHAKVKIICPDHGVFEQTPDRHYYGGCQQCSIKFVTDGTRKSLHEFIAEAISVHGEKYDYSLAEYNGAHSFVKIVCPDHGSFMQRAKSHVQGHGCEACSISHGEKRIERFLDKYTLAFEQQKRFSSCKDRRILPFDFFISRHNILIEYDGRQHFGAYDFFGGEEAYDKRKRRDAIKNEFAKKNGFNLLRIPYTKKDQIESILSVYLKNLGVIS